MAAPLTTPHSTCRQAPTASRRRRLLNQTRAAGFVPADITHQIGTREDPANRTSDWLSFVSQEVTLRPCTKQFSRLILPCHARALLHSHEQAPVNERVATNLVAFSHEDQAVELAPASSERQGSATRESSPLHSLPPCYKRLCSAASRAPNSTPSQMQSQRRR